MSNFKRYDNSANQNGRRFQNMGGDYQQNDGQSPYHQQSPYQKHSTMPAHNYPDQNQNYPNRHAPREEDDFGSDNDIPIKYANQGKGLPQQNQFYQQQPYHQQQSLRHQQPDAQNIYSPRQSNQHPQNQFLGKFLNDQLNQNQISPAPKQRSQVKKRVSVIDESSLSDQDDKDVDEGTIVASKKSIQNTRNDQNIKSPQYDRFNKRNPPIQQQDDQRFYPHNQSNDQADPEQAEEWNHIQSKIDQEYQKKLKELNDEAANKLKNYERDYKDLIEKTKFLYTNKKRTGSRAESVGSNNSRANSKQSNLSNLSFLSSNKGGKNNRNRFFSPKAINAPRLEEQIDEQKDSETKQIKEFYKEYCSVVKKNVDQQNQIYLVDVLEQLHFVHDEAVNDNRSKLCQILREHKPSLMVYSKSGEYSGEKEDIIKNFFKVCCGILNLKLKQRGHNQLDDNLLKSYVGAINYNHQIPEFITMDQFHTIKSLINRKAYCLNPKQIEYIHQNFKSMFIERKNFKDAEDRLKQKIRDQERQKQLMEEQQRDLMHYKMQHETPKNKQNENPQIYQSNQLKSSFPKNESEDNQMYTYKPMSRQYRQIKQPNILFQEKKPESRHGPSKRPWSGARPHSGSKYSGSRGSETRGVMPSRFQNLSNSNTFQKNGLPQSKQVLSPRANLYGNTDQKNTKPIFPQNIINQNPQGIKGRKQSQYSDMPGDESDLLNGSFGHPSMQQSTYKPNHFQNQRNDEPICILKIELDGEHVEEIKVYEGEDPFEIVQHFGSQFNLSENAKKRLYTQIKEQIEQEQMENQYGQNQKSMNGF